MKKHKSDNIGSKAISEAERSQLKVRILASVENHKRKKKRFKYALAMAASIALLLSTGIYFNSFHNEKDSITDFVKKTHNLQNKNTEKVTLTIGKGQNVGLDEDDPLITYSASGKNVKIGNSKSLNQETVDDDKLVYNTLVVPYGKRSKIQLSDGSIVWINSGSRLVYPAVFKKDRREVYIEGEAIFEVVHNDKQPFVVLSENQQIEVLGTVFNVNNYPDENSAFTVLKSGSVQISYGDSTAENYDKDLKISPGTFAGYNKVTDKMSSKKVEVNRYFSWREGIFIFKNDDLKTIMRRLSRYYDMDIKIENEKLASQTFSGYLDLKDDIEEVIETIKKTADLKYDRTGKQTITITN